MAKVEAEWDGHYWTLPDGRKFTPYALGKLNRYHQQQTQAKREDVPADPADSGFFNQLGTAASSLTGTIVSNAANAFNVQLEMSPVKRIWRGLGFQARSPEESLTQSLGFAPTPEQNALTYKAAQVFGNRGPEDPIGQEKFHFDPPPELLKELEAGKTPSEIAAKRSNADLGDYELLQGQITPEEWTQRQTTADPSDFIREGLPKERRLAGADAVCRPWRPTVTTSTTGTTNFPGLGPSLTRWRQSSCAVH